MYYVQLFILDADYSISYKYNNNDSGYLVVAPDLRKLYVPKPRYLPPRYLPPPAPPLLVGFSLFFLAFLIIFIM